MANEQGIPYYIREREFPTIWCAGCGHGIIVKAAIRAVQKLGLAKDEVFAVSGIGCSARAPAYLDFNSIQTTHGRAICFATGMKIFKPEKHLLLFLGDGDCAAIGGNHYIHAARRNIDMTVIIMNNFIYGMTGGQGSPTTPPGGFSTTTPLGNVEPAMDLCAVAAAAGATFVARTTAYHVNQLAAFIELGMKNKGFSVIECIDPCPTGYGRRNSFAGPVAMYEWLRDAAIPVEKAGPLPEKDLAGKIVTGILANSTRPEYIETYQRSVRANAAEPENAAAGENDIPAKALGSDRIEIRLSGSGGQGLILAGIILGEAAIAENKNAVHSQSYGTEARGGASRSEVILADGPVNFPEVSRPDILLAMTQQAGNKFIPGVRPGGIALIDSTFVNEVPDTPAQVYKAPITRRAIDQFGTDVVANILALGVIAGLTGIVSFHSLRQAVGRKVPERMREINTRALSEGWKMGEAIGAESLPAPHPA